MWQYREVPGKARRELGREPSTTRLVGQWLGRLSWDTVRYPPLKTPPWLKMSAIFRRGDVCLGVFK
jgi:hypothetical protein